jgi:uracil-DNA glycosylase family 4
VRLAGVSATSDSWSANMRFIRAGNKKQCWQEALGLPGKELLAVVASEVTVCTRCPLCKARKNAVPGEGSAKSKVMFIGEAPGRSEDARGRPFVGAAGKFLDELMSEVGVSRENGFITNVVKCRPPRNRVPKSSEVQACTPYLDRQMRILKPKFIATLGNYATAYIFSKAKLLFSGITLVHGKPHEATILSMKVIVFPIFHPATALYNPKYKTTLRQDFQSLKDEVERALHSRKG